MLLKKKSSTLSWLWFLLFGLQIVLQYFFLCVFYLFIYLLMYFYPHHHLEDSLLCWSVGTLRDYESLLTVLEKMAVNTCTWLLLKRQPGTKASHLPACAFSSVTMIVKHLETRYWRMQTTWKLKIMWIQLQTQKTCSVESREHWCFSFTGNCIISWCTNIVQICIVWRVKAQHTAS